MDWPQGTATTQRGTERRRRRFGTRSRAFSHDHGSALTVTFTIGGLHPEMGGPSRSVPSLCGALAILGTTIELFSLDLERGMKSPRISHREGVNTTLVPSGETAT